jgi:hypothetical protein
MRTIASRLSHFRLRDILFFIVTIILVVTATLSVSLPRLR